MNRKLRKFFKNPKAFWRDSKWNINNRLLLSNKQIHHQSDIPLIDKKALLKPLPFPFNIKFIISQLDNLHTQAIYIKPLKENEKWAICVNINDKKDFFNKFLEFAYQEGIEIRYKLHGKIKTPKSLNELWADISLVKHLDVRLSTLRTIAINRIWFRLEFWEEFEDYYLSPVSNHISRKLYKSSAKKYKIFEDANMFDYSKILAKPHEKEINFDIDLVFTWVNSNDEDWKKIYTAHKPISDTEASSNSRFLSRDELKYALRSWAEYGQFIRNTYIVSNCKPPDWLDLTQENIKWVYHEEIMPTDVLPTFSSHAIETSLHKIKGLSNYFIYSNDDVLLVKPTSGNDFFFPNGIVKLKLEPYGNVNGTIKEGDPDYLNAARNVTKLLENDFQKTPTQLHTHASQAMRIDILNKMEEKYSYDFKRTMSNKFRTITDISVTSYMYPHFTFLSGNGLQTDIKIEFIQHNHDFKKKLHRLIHLKNIVNLGKLPLSVCLNDGGDSHLNDLWNKEIMHFLETFFPEKSKYEKS